ncbi:MAG TPA: hypothetical protein PJ982_10945, partial [Lacipirellulaceae bacterium]|nr:hypothetical protein [Lacipirellulaceae bacterium]
MAVKTKRHQFSDDEEDENLDELEMDNEDLFADEEVGESPGEDEDEDEAKEMSDGDEEGVAPSDKLAEVADLLATEVGVKLPDDVTEEDLVEKLHGALVAFKHAKEYHEGGEKAAEMSEDEGDEGDDGGLGLELSDEDELDGLDEDEEAKAKAKEKAEKEPMTLQMSRRLDNQSRRLAIAEKQLAEERLSKFKFFIGRLVREGRVSPKV